MDNRTRARDFLHEQACRTGYPVRALDEEQLTALLDSVRREAMEQAVAECERIATVQASAVDTTARDGGAFFTGGHNAASVCAEAIRALATPTKPGDETK